MYRVYYYVGNTSMVNSKNFPNLKEATEFSLKQPKDSVIEVKHYDDKTNNIQNQPHDFSSY